MRARARLRETGAADARRQRRTLERWGRAGAAQTRVAPAVQTGLGQVQATAAAYRGRSRLHGGDLVKHPGWRRGGAAEGAGIIVRSQIQ